MPIEVELGVPLRNPNSQSDYSQTLRKAIQHSNQIARRNLEIDRTRQASQYNSKSQRDWEPFEIGQTVWLWRPKHWKFGKRWTGPYKVSSRDGVNYKLISSRGKALVAHNNWGICIGYLHWVFMGEAGEKTGPGGLPPKKSLKTTPFRTSENAPILKNKYFPAVENNPIITGTLVLLTIKHFIITTLDTLITTHTVMS